MADFIVWQILLFCDSYFYLKNESLSSSAAKVIFALLFSRPFATTECKMDEKLIMATKNPHTVCRFYGVHCIDSYPAKVIVLGLFSTDANALQFLR